MAISWQTGEPPCGQELLIEYCFHDKGQTWRAIIESTKVLRREVNVLRWSTLDDDRSAMAMVALGALETLLLANPSPCVEIDRYDGLWHVRVYDDQLGSIAPTGVSSSLIEAIEKLTEAGNGLQGD